MRNVSGEKNVLLLTQLSGFGSLHFWYPEEVWELYRLPIPIDNEIMPLPRQVPSLLCCLIFSTCCCKKLYPSSPWFSCTGFRPFKDLHGLRSASGKNCFSLLSSHSWLDLSLLKFEYVFLTRNKLLVYAVCAELSAGSAHSSKSNFHASNARRLHSELPPAIRPKMPVKNLSSTQVSCLA